MEKINVTEKERKAVGRALRSLRETHKLKQYQVSEQVDISRFTYAAYEAGKNMPNIFILYKIAAVYDMSIDDIMHLTMAELRL